MVSRMKWLIDANLNPKIFQVLQRYGYKDYVRDSGMLSNHDFCVIIILIPKSVPQKNILDWFELEIKEQNIPYYPGKAIFWP